MVLPTLKTIQSTIRGIHFPTSMSSSKREEKVVEEVTTKFKGEGFVNKGWLQMTFFANTSQSKGLSKRNFCQLYPQSRRLIYFEIEPGIPERIINLENSIVHADSSCKNSFWICTKDTKRYHLEDISEENKDRWLTFLSNVDGVKLKAHDDPHTFDDVPEYKSPIDPIKAYSPTRNDENKIMSLDGVGFHMIGDHLREAPSKIPLGIHKFDIISSHFLEAQKFQVLLYKVEESQKLEIYDEANVFNSTREGHPVISVEYSIENDGDYILEISLTFGKNNLNQENLNSFMIPSGRYYLKTESSSPVLKKIDSISSLTPISIPTPISAT